MHACRIALGIALVAAVAGCGDGDTAQPDASQPAMSQPATTAPPATTQPVTTAPPATTQPATTQPATTQPTPAARRAATDVAYHDGTGGDWLPPLLDVYAPEAGGEGLPVVVMFHGGVGGEATKSYFEELAMLTAARGAVVFVPTHGSRDAGAPDVAQAAELHARDIDGAACALAYAAATAPDYGGDPARLVVFGHSWGAAVASTVALRGPRPFPGCAVDPVPYDVGRLVLWDGDYLMAGSPYPDQMWGTEVHTVLDATSPWPWLDTADPPLTSVIMSGLSPAEGWVRPVPDTTEDWLAARDPDGVHTARLQALGALDDGEMDINEESELLADAMRELDDEVVELIVLPESGHEWSTVSAADRDTLVSALLR